MALEMARGLLSFCLVVLLWSPLGAALSFDDCPSNLPRDQYLRIRGNSCYTFVLDHELVYTSAELECEAGGGHLVVIRTFDTQKFVYQTLRNELNFRGVVWIGLSDVRDDGSWIWADGSDVHYSRWAQGQPAIPGSGKHCAILNVTDEGSWKSDACNAIVTPNERSFVCEFPVLINHATAKTTPAGTLARSTTKDRASITIPTAKPGLSGSAPVSSGGLTVWVHEDDSRVQVFHNGLWTSICADHWDNSDAQVICRMQGYWHGQGTAELRPLQPSDIIMLNDVSCTGNETSLDQCHYNGFRSQYCSIGVVGAVSCQPKGEVRVRLADGFGPWEGRLEVEGSSGVWRPVCRTGFDDLDAQVVCRMLGIRTEGGKAHTEDKFNQSSLPPLIHQMDCTGQEADISQCKGSEASEGENCRNAGVECYSCGGLYTSSSGVLQSENYPLSYPGNQNCLYIIRPTNQQVLYKLEFGNFSTEECCDTLQVKVLNDSSNLPGGGTLYSGSRAPPPKQIGKAFALSFVTDGSHSLQGFHAVWSQVSVADLVSVTCQDGRFTVDVDLNLLRLLHPQSGPSSIALADPACRGVVQRSADGKDHLIITSNLNSCGTRVVSGNNSLEYHNFVVDRVFSSVSSMIVRDRRWTLPFRCSFDAADHVQVHYIPVLDVRRRNVPAAAISPEVAGSSPEDGNAHDRKTREVRGSVVSSRFFSVDLSFFTDRSFTQTAWPPISRRLGDEIDLRLEIPVQDPDLKLAIQQCYAEPILGHHDTTYYYYELIKQGCVLDSTTEIVHLQRNTIDFRFNAFEFAGYDPHLYISCTVRVCPVSDNSTSCSQTCLTPGLTSPGVVVVGKRGGSASEPIRQRHVKDTAGPGLSNVSVGPIVL